MTTRPLASLLLAAALAAANACGASVDPGPAARAPARTAEVTPAGRDAPGNAEVERLADRLMARARQHEPRVSALLGRVASQVGGRMAGFEHRLKTRASLVRKIHQILHDNPGWTASDVRINDALRYTIEVGDAPPGHHADSIRVTFAALEAAGHRVVRVKNYWPRGDNYSGVNSVLAAPDGLEWELQFHTPESFRIKTRDTYLYDELREVSTAPGRKRQLYFELAAPWDSVPIPAHMLDPKALHRNEEIIRRPPP
jgi:hypothetical protein